MTPLGLFIIYFFYEFTVVKNDNKIQTRNKLRYDPVLQHVSPAFVKNMIIVYEMKVRYST